MVAGHPKPKLFNPSFGQTLQPWTPQSQTTMWLKISWLKSLGLRSLLLKCPDSNGLQDIATLDFSTQDVSTMNFHPHSLIGVWGWGVHTMFDTHHSVTFATELLGQLYEKTSSDRQNHVTTPRLMQIWFTQNSQGVSCDRFLRRTHAPRTSRSRFALQFFGGRTSHPHSHL